MGLENRDYIRNSPSTGFGGGPSFGRTGGFSAVTILLIANAICFVIERSALEPVLNWFVLHRDTVLHGEVWRLITYGFLHSPQDIGHIAFNMFGLWIFGRMIEPVIGRTEFFAFYFVGILAGGVGHVLLTPAGALGASAAVVAVTILAAMKFPRMKIMFMFVIPMELRFLAALYVITDVFGLAGFGERGIGNAAHLAGALFAFGYHQFGWHLTGHLPNVAGLRKWKPMKRRPALKVHQPASEPSRRVADESDDRVDEILAKITAEGEASLTDEEREVLINASRKINHRAGR